MFDFLSKAERAFLEDETYLLGGFHREELDKFSLLKNLRMESVRKDWVEHGFDESNLDRCIEEVDKSSFPQHGLSIENVYEQFKQAEGFEEIPENMNEYVSLKDAATLWEDFNQISVQRARSEVKRQTFEHVFALAYGPVWQDLLESTNDSVNKVAVVWGRVLNQSKLNTLEKLERAMGKVDSKVSQEQWGIMETLRIKLRKAIQRRDGIRDLIEIFRQEILARVGKLKKAQAKGRSFAMLKHLAKVMWGGLSRGAKTSRAEYVKNLNQRRRWAVVQQKRQKAALRELEQGKSGLGKDTASEFGGDFVVGERWRFQKELTYYSDLDRQREIFNIRIASCKQALRLLEELLPALDKALMQKVK